MNGSLVGSEYPIKVAVGGKVDTAWGDPNQLGNPALLVVSPPIDSRPSLYVHNRSVLLDSNTEVFTINSKANPSGSTAHYMMRIWRNGVPVFNVDGQAPWPVCNCPGGFVTGPADMAEVLETVDSEEFLKGTVMVIGEDGKLKPSDSIADTGVAGVVSINPGLILGKNQQYDFSTTEHLGIFPTTFGRTKILTFSENPELEKGDLLRIRDAVYSVENCSRILGEQDRPSWVVEVNDTIDYIPNTPIYRNVVKRPVAHVAAVGRVQVRCSSSEGQINPRTLLVSGPDGCAVAASENAPSAAILGKALGSLTGETGLVEALISW
jgi:hypothetical protein